MIFTKTWSQKRDAIKQTKFEKQLQRAQQIAQLRQVAGEQARVDSQIERIKQAQNIKQDYTYSSCFSNTVMLQQLHDSTILFAFLVFLIFEWWKVHNPSLFTINSHYRRTTQKNQLRGESRGRTEVSMKNILFQWRYCIVHEPIVTFSELLHHMASLCQLDCGYKCSLGEDKYAFVAMAGTAPATQSLLNRRYCCC